MIPCDEEQANIAASLRPATKQLGLSLGGRSCLALALALALARVRSARVVTADSNWKKLEGFDVLAVRGV